MVVHLQFKGPLVHAGGLNSIPIVIVRPVLIAPGNGPGWVAAAVSNIEIDAVAAAGHRTAAVISTAVTTPAVSARGLVLRRDHAIRIAPAVDVHIIAVAAVLHWVHRTALGRRFCSELSGQGYGNKGEYHIGLPAADHSQRRGAIVCSAGSRWRAFSMAAKTKRPQLRGKGRS